MGKKQRGSTSERERQLVAQEAARIVVNHGVRDYRLAKQKAADRLGMSNRGSLPGNAETELHDIGIAYRAYERHL